MLMLGLLVLQCAHSFSRGILLSISTYHTNHRKTSVKIMNLDNMLFCLCYQNDTFVVFIISLSLV